MPTRKHIFPVVMVAVVLSVLGAAPRAAERVALVIGNAAYEHTTTLRNPRNDVGRCGSARSKGWDSRSSRVLTSTRGRSRRSFANSPRPCGARR